MPEALLALNTGSSSIKIAVYSCTAAGPLLYLRGRITGIGAKARFSANSESGSAPLRAEQELAGINHEQAMTFLLDWLKSHMADFDLIGAAHRVVHGGERYCSATLINAQVLVALRELIPLAPLHQVHGLRAIDFLMKAYPDLPQVACFDTAFHAQMPAWEKSFALPRALTKQGIRRYGFHGLSYAYIASVLAAELGELAGGKIIVAHLGHGASMCSIRDSRSIATSMSFTPLDGLPMGTRCGSLDPAVVLYLLQQGKTAAEVSELLHHQSGLLGISGLSDDMQTLLASDSVAAKEAVEYFCYRIVRELGSQAAALQGIDALVFTGGIGEHAAEVRARICEQAAWLGLKLDKTANQSGAGDIAAPGSRVAIRVIATDEEYMIAKEALAVLRGT